MLKLTHRIRLVLVPLALLFVWCSRGTESKPNEHGANGGSTAEPEALPCIAPIIARNCAKAECHDAITKDHGMDLSTGDTIYEAWVGVNGMGRNGLDHCRNVLRKRVTPGVPEESFVMLKITGTLACEGELSQPMPPPPNVPLSPEEILAVRAWIADGATKDCSRSDGGTNPPDDAGTGGMTGTGGTAATGGTAGAETGGTGAATGGTTTGGSGGDGTAGSGPVDGGMDDGGMDDGGTVEPWQCTNTQPCVGGTLCVGYECGVVWTCESHYIEPDSGVLEHPCPMEIATYCGCDGVTFESPVTCPERPYRHVGDCGSGYDCDTWDDRCFDGGMPTCPPGQAPSVDFDNCFSDCVPSTSCRCEYNWECPAGYKCDTPAQFCVEAPDVDAGM